MKKKIALLLALTMIVSILPMNVFGATTLDVPERYTVAGGLNLPGTVIDRLHIDLADLDEDGHTGEMFDGDWRGYPIELELSDDATFGTGPNKNIVGVFDNDVLPAGSIGYNNNTDSVYLRSLIEYVNFGENIWHEWNGMPSPAKTYTWNNPDREENAPGLTGLDNLAEGEVGKTTTTSSGSIGTVGGMNAINNFEWLWGDTTEDQEYFWDEFDALSGYDVVPNPKGPAAQTALDLLTVTYDYDVKAADHITLYVQIFDAEGNWTSPPDRLDDGEIYIDFALPIYLLNTDDGWNAELSVTDGSDLRYGDSIGSFPRRVIRDTEASLTVDVNQAASFASTGFLDTVSLNESVFGFIRGGSVDPMVVELKVDSDHAWLMENAREKLNFSDETNTFHDNSGDSRFAYELYDYFGGDNEETNYNFYYEVGNRDRSVISQNDQTAYDIRFIFPAGSDTTLSRMEGSLDDEEDLIAPTDPGANQGRYSRSNRDRSDQLNIHNLMVGFDDRQNFGEELPIQYRAYTVENTDSDASAEIIWTDSNNNDVVDNTEVHWVGRDGAINDDNSYDRTYLTDDGRSGWETSDNIAVTRQQDVVQLDVLDDRLGVVDADGPQAVVSGKFFEETSPFRIAETVNGTWDTGNVVMSVGDGVEIMGAHVSVYEYEFEDYDTTDRAEDGARVESTTWNAAVNDSLNSNWTWDGDTGARDEDYLEIYRHNDYYNNGGIKVTNKEIEIDPRMTDVTAKGERREIEVQLELSIEAGYVQKGRNTVDPTAIDIAFSGPGASNFEAPSLTVARVHDPITVSAPAPITATEQNWETTAYENVIGDITVTEGAVGDLQQDDEIWLYVVGDRQIDLTLDAGRTPVVSNAAESGLELYDGVQLRHTFGNFWLSGVRYNVQRESGYAASSAPAVITFEDVTISGAMYQGASYAIVISGNAVAENDYTVWANSGEWLQRIVNSGTIDSYDYNSFYDGSNDRGVFDEEPYLIEAINWDENSYNTPPTTEEAPTTEVQPEVSVPRTPVEFGPYSYSTDETGTFNNFYMAAASNGVGYAGISPRGFAGFIKGETTFDEATRTATVTGKDNFGADVTVTLTIGSTSATVNGQTVDIATYNEHPGYPAGSIMPFQPGNNRTYLPIRFLCKAFGVQFNWNPTTSSVTLY